MQEFIDYSLEHQGLLLIAGNPMSDEMVVAFGGKQVYVKFPPVADPKEHVLVQAMNKSRFKESMNEILVGLIKTLELTETDGNQVYQVIAGGLQAIVNDDNEIKKETVLTAEPVASGD